MEKVAARHLPKSYTETVTADKITLTWRSVVLLLLEAVICINCRNVTSS
jgi:hypothetical protein